MKLTTVARLTKAEAILERIVHLAERLALATVNSQPHRALSVAIRIEAAAYRECLGTEQATATHDAKPSLAGAFPKRTTSPGRKNGTFGQDAGPLMEHYAYAGPRSESPVFAHDLMEVLMMSDAARQEPGHRRPHAPPMASTFLEFDLTAEVNRLRGETTWNTGRNTRTLVKYDDFRVVLMALQANRRIPEHKTDGRISVHMLSGHIRLNASGRTFDLRPGSLVALDQGSSHDIEALEDSAFLLTIAWPGRTATPSA